MEDFLVDGVARLRLLRAKEQKLLERHERILNKIKKNKEEEQKLSELMWFNAVKENCEARRDFRLRLNK